MRPVGMEGIIGPAHQAKITRQVHSLQIKCPDSNLAKCLEFKNKDFKFQISNLKFKIFYPSIASAFSRQRSSANCISWCRAFIRSSLASAGTWIGAAIRRAARENGFGIIMRSHELSTQTRSTAT